MKQISFYHRFFCRWTGLAFVLVGLVGCSQQVQHEYAVGTKEPVTSPVPLPTPQLNHESSSVLSDLPYVDLPSSSVSSVVSPANAKRNLSPVEELVHRLRLESRLYLAKDGTLLGDFTVFNHHPVPVSHLRVECAEYNLNQVLLKTSNRPLGKAQKIAPEAQQFFGEVDFGYVDDGFDTVTCRLYSAKLG